VFLAAFGELRRKTTSAAPPPASLFRAHGAFGKLRPLRNSFCLIQSEIALRNKEASSSVKTHAESVTPRPG
jgi:hypothetical protein